MFTELSEEPVLGRQKHLLIIIGGKKGLKSLLGLVFTVICVLYMFLPMVFIGCPPVPAAITTGILCAFVSLCVLNGLSFKSLSAILGTIAGVIAAGLMYTVIGFFANITIFNTQEAETLYLLAQNVPIKLNGILFAGIIIASLGAVMDIGMSISSSVFEIHSVSRINSTKQLFISGLSIGKDMMGTMTNTLVLAFAGSSLNTLILLYSYNMPFNQLMNSSILGLEVLQAVSGTIGILAAVPVTAYISGWLCSKNR